ncbi:hypothetical protein MMC14_005807 [Varicellaria rhodocarpa]|nr:hypothetical protein [Varicellaria rhodocarpa]
MERNGWMGVCCEPNMVFVVCNQFPLIAIRYNNSRTGTKHIDDILGKYKAAWKIKGMIAQDGLLVDFWRPKQDDSAPAMDISWSAWASAYMNSWNSAQVKELFPSQSLGSFTRLSPTCINPNTAPIASATRSLVASEGLDPCDPQTHQQALEKLSKESQPPVIPFTKHAFGYVAQWLSELGEEETLNGPLNYADQNLHPTWEQGGLYYPCHDQSSNK